MGVLAVVRHIEAFHSMKNLAFHSRWKMIILPPGWVGLLIIYILGGGVPPGPENPYPIQTKICDFPYPISDLPLKMYPLFQTLWCVENCGNF